MCTPGATTVNSAPKLLAQNVSPSLLPAVLNSSCSFEAPTAMMGRGRDRLAGNDTSLPSLPAAKMTTLPSPFLPRVAAAWIAPSTSLDGTDIVQLQFITSAPNSTALSNA